MKQKLLRKGLMLLAAVFAGSIMQAQDVYDISTFGAGQTNGTVVTVLNGANSSITFGKGSGTNDPKFYGSGSEIRFYGKNTMTVAANAGGTITDISFEYTSKSPKDGGYDISTGSYDYSAQTWTGNASSVTLNSTVTGQYVIKKITVTIEGDLKTATTLTFGEDVDGQTITVLQGKEGEFSAPKATLTPAEAGQVAYQSDNEAVARVDATTGAVTFGSELGQATITASYAGNDTYGASSAQYTIDYKKDWSHALFYESFDQNTGQGGNDGLWNGNAGQGDITYDNEGWTLGNGGRANKCVKLGASKEAGSIETPALAGLNGDATLYFKAGAWKGDATTLNVTVSGGGQIANGTVTLPDAQWADYELTILGGTAETKIMFASDPSGDNRFFLDEVAVVATGSSTVVVAAPVIEGQKEFDGKATVTITAEDGATIYYTTDGTEPTQESQEYTAPFDVTEATTVKAIAVKDGKASAVATKEFRPIEYMTIAGINDFTKNQAGLNVKFTEAKVTYVDGKDIYLREGDMAVMLYNTNLEMPVNATVSGTVKMDYKNYRGIHELVDNAETTADKLTITPSDVPAEPTPATIEELLAMEHICDYVLLSKVTITSEQSDKYTNYYANADGQKVQLYGNDDAVKDYAGDGKEYNLTAVFNAIYNGAAEVQPIAVTPYVAPSELAAPVIDGPAEFEGKATVTITAEDGATIYYTTDGSEPTKESQEYTAPFDVTATTTVKAIAVKDGQTSPVAEKTLTAVEFTAVTIASLHELTADKAYVNLTLTRAKVVYVDGNTIHLREGDMAIMLYNTALEIPANAIVSGNVKGDFAYYNGLPELKDNAFTNADGLTITESLEEAHPTHATIAELLALKHKCDYVMLTRVTITSEQDGEYTNYYANADGQKIQLFGNNKAVESYANDGKEYDLFAVFNQIYNGTAEIEPIHVTTVNGISGVEADAALADQPVYNLAGQRLQKPQKGLNIIGGKKVVIK